MRVAFSNLGCKLNQAELEGLARDFQAAGHRVVASLEEADLHVVNSCTVTLSAARDSRRTARRSSRLERPIPTVLTGCYVESDAETAAKLAGVELVVPNADKARLLDRVEAAFPELAAADSNDAGRPRSAIDDLPYMPIGFGNARALVKIEDGCNMTCTFCIIPSTRGSQRSRVPDEVVAEVQALVDAGHAEVVITGVQISSYRREGMGLYELTARVLDETTVPRLRLSSIAPWQFDLRLLDLFATGRLCRHFHLSLQSGSDATLRRMLRPYSSDRFRALVTAIRERLPGVAITTDVIVGFPAESDEEFEESLTFVESMGFARVHAFPFSPRPGTAAAEMSSPVPHTVLRDRMSRMLTVARASTRRFAASQVGETVSVLWESAEGSRWRGTSDNYLRVETDSDLALSRSLRAIKLTGARDQGAHGELEPG